MAAVIKRYAVLDGNGIIQNIAAWDGVTPWPAPEGCTVQECAVDIPYFIGLKPGEVPPPPPDDTTAGAP